MPNWKKLILSGSNASLNSLIVTSGVTGSLFGTASWSQNTVSASFAHTASYVNILRQNVVISGSLTVSSSLTASGLNYPTTDGLYSGQVLQTNAAGILSFGDPTALYETIYNGESTTLTKGTVVYISGSQGSNPKAYRADASNSSKMPVSFVIAESIATAATGRGVQLGLLTGFNTTAFGIEGTQLYVDGSGSLTATRPTGSTDTIQLIATVIQQGNGGKINVLNPGPVLLPNIQSGHTWVGNTSNYPIAVATSSIHNVISSSYAINSTNAVTASLVNGSVNVSTAYIGGALYTTSTSNAVSTNSTIFTISTVGTYTSGFIDYHVTDGSGNARSGQIQIAYVGGQVAHNETATQDIGNTSGFQWDVQVSGSDINLESIVTSGVWDIKLIAKVF